MSKSAFVAAMEREVRPLVRDWLAVDKTHDGRQFRFFETGNVVVVAGGIGASAARRVAEAVVAFYGPDILYSVGLAGALDSALKVGDIIKPARVINASDGSRVDIESGTGVLVSLDSVASVEQKGNLLEAFSAIAVDMEAAAVARAAEAHGKAFGVVKAISDESDFELPPMEKFIRPDGSFAELRFGLNAAVQPWMWAKVYRSARNSNLASRALCVALRAIVSAQNSEVHTTRTI